MIYQETLIKLMANMLTLAELYQSVEADVVSGKCQEQLAWERLRALVKKFLVESKKDIAPMLDKLQQEVDDETL